MMQPIRLDKNHFDAVHTAIDNVHDHDEQLLRVVKSEKIMEFDENAYAKLNDCQLHNGIIEVKMISRRLSNQRR